MQLHFSLFWVCYQVTLGLLAIRRVYIFWSGGSTRSRTWRVSQEFLMQTFHDEWPSICWLVASYISILNLKHFIGKLWRARYFGLRSGSFVIVSLYFWHCSSFIIHFILVLSDLIFMYFNNLGFLPIYFLLTEWERKCHPIPYVI